MAFLFPLSLVFLDLIFFFAFLLNAFLFTVLSFLPLNVIFLILLSSRNALELIVLTAFPITTVSSFEHFLNAFFPITVTLLPIDNRRKIGGRNRAKDKIINQTVFFCTAVMGTIVSSIASTSRMLTMRLRVFVFVILSFSPSKLF